MKRIGLNLFLAVLLTTWNLLPSIGHTEEKERSSFFRDHSIQSIHIVPSTLHLKPGESCDVRVIARDADGGNTPVSRAVLTAKGKSVTVTGLTVKALKAGEGKITATYRGKTAEAKVWVQEKAKGNPHSTYRFEYSLPKPVGTGQYITAPITLSTDKEGGKGYNNVHIAFEKTAGPGDVLFRTTGKTGRVRSFLNTGEWMKPGFDLPAKYRQTTDWTLKFSKTGRYTIAFQVKTKKGEIIAETPLDVTVTPHFTDLGVQVANLTIMTGAFGKDQAGRDTGYTVVVGDPGKLVVVDVQSEKVTQTINLPGATGSWTITVDDDGTVYIGTYPNGRMYKYVPGADRVEDLGQPVAGTTVVYGLVKGKNGKIYGGTYPGGNLFEYDPARGFTNFGPMAAGENYVRDVVYDPVNEVLYAGVGAHAHLIKYDLTTGAKRDLLPKEYAENSFVYDLNLIGDKLLIKIDPGHKIVVLNTDSGAIEAEFVAYSHSPSVIPSPDGKVAYYTYDGHLYEYHLDTKTSKPVMIGGNPATLGQTAIGWDFVQLNDPAYPGPTLFGFIGNYEGKAFKYNPQTQALNVITLPLPPQPTDIYNVAAGPEGNIYSNGYLSGGVGVYSPDTGKLVRYSKGIGQSESIVALGEKMYFGVYPEAKIYEYDPVKPWKAGQNPKLLFSMQSKSQNRPRAMTGSEEHRQLFIGTTPYYGQLGGAFAVYDTVTGEKQVYRNIVPNQSVISLAYKDGKVYAGTSIYGGDSSDPVEKEAKLFVWDIATGQKVGETVPVPGETAIGALLVGPDGNIWGFAQGALFIYNPKTGKVLYRKEKFPNLHYSTGGVDLEIGLDGYIYGTAGGKFFKIDPTSKEVTVLRNNHSHFLAQDPMGNFYFKNGPSAPYGNTLWRYTIEDNTISVTGITLNRTKLNLSAGKTGALKAKIEPTFATNRTVFWRSDNIGVATVDKNGNVKAMAPGIAKVTVTTEDGGLKATCMVTVN